MSSITDATIMHHVIIVLLVLWMLNSYNYSHPIAYFLSLVYLYMVHEVYEMRLRRKLQNEEKRNANQRRVLSDSESVRWLNYAIEKLWPICMEEIVSQKILLPIVPWFLQKYKPWTAKEVTVQHLYLGRSPPMFTEMRVLSEPGEDDHLVLELGMSFVTAGDMSSLLAIKLRKALGLGMVAKLHLLGLHIEGKVLVGVKFIRKWPYISRLRICFAEPPYFQMTVKPLIAHGVDVTELPGIAGWLDKLLGVAFEQTLVEPNMLVVDVEKFVAPEPENWFSVDAKEPIAHAIVEVLEADEIKPSDLNGLSDPYVKGRLGPYRFRTEVKKKTLAPKWQEEFRVPVCSWENPILKIEVRDKDRLVDDKLGDCSIDVGDLRGGQRHDIWLSLKNIKVGRLHLAITVVEAKGNGKESEEASAAQTLNDLNEKDFHANESASKESFPEGKTEKSQRVLDKIEPIVIEGQEETGIWVLHPGSEVAQIWEPRKGRTRVGSQIHCESGDGSVKSMGSGSGHNEGSSSDESGEDASKPHERNRIRRGLHKIGSVFQRSPKGDDKSILTEDPIPSPHANLKSVNTKDISVKYVVDAPVSAPSSTKPTKLDGNQSPEGSTVESPSKRGNMKGMAKGFMKHAGKSAQGIKYALSRNSRKPKAEVFAEADRDTSTAISNSSDDETLMSPVDSPGLCGDSFKSREDVHQTMPDDDFNNATEIMSTDVHETAPDDFNNATEVMSPDVHQTMPDTEIMSTDVHETAPDDDFNNATEVMSPDVHQTMPDDDFNNATKTMSTENTKSVDAFEPLSDLPKQTEEYVEMPVLTIESMEKSDATL
ncbi:hypothetical protein LIER_36891 [Lithospermum erythrorhizon]|uniref:C2 domain-containing protein n=1 Tax=Lithospermum erythrorhizon TaxID=34254 RepID=A0AAV3PDN6_LITER